MEWEEVLKTLKDLGWLIAQLVIRVLLDKKLTRANVALLQKACHDLASMSQKLDQVIAAGKPPLDKLV